MTVSPAAFEHLLRLSDGTGLLEHAKGAVPRRGHGYCVDDVARGLVVLARQPDPPAALVTLSGTYLAFVAHAQAPDGTFHNRLGYERRWRDQPGTGDWWGRALWGLGAVVAGSGPAWQRDEALDRFTLGCRQRSPWLRALSFAALGAAAVVGVAPDHLPARALLADTLAAVGRPRSGAWPWPEPRLAYANACVAEAVLVSGAALEDDIAISDGLVLLEWLVARQTLGEHLSPVPVGGAGPRSRPPGFDQQPIEVAAIADAAAAALTITGDERWRPVIGQALGWFLGRNDVGALMHDPATGGGYDGLTVTGPNRNQGAESSLAWLLTAQHRATAVATTRPVPVGATR